MLSQVDQFQSFAERKISESFQSKDAKEIYPLLCSKDLSFSTYPRKCFSDEWILFRLALGSLAWHEACLENHIEDKAIQKMFIQKILRTFKAPESLPQATAFSEYIYSADGTHLNGEVVLLVERFLARLSKKSKGLPKSSIALRVCFQTLVEVAESLRMSLQNGFLDIFHFDRT